MEAPNKKEFELDFYSIARDWRAALAPTAPAPFRYNDTTNKLAALVRDATRLLFEGAYESEKAEQIGSTLADLNFTQVDALGLSMKVLSNAWITNIPTAVQEGYPEEMVTLFSDMANGFYKSATTAILTHYERINKDQLSSPGDIHEVLRHQRDNLRLTAERLQTLLDIESRILAAQSAEAIADVAITHIMRIIPCSLAVIVTVDLQNDAFVVLASNIDPETIGDLISTSLTTDERLQIFENSESIITNDISSLENRVPGLENIYSRGIKSALSIPLKTKDELVGLLLLGSRKVNNFTDQHDEIVRQIADSVAVALHNRQLLETEQRARRESETLREVAASLSSNLEQEQLLENILFQLESLLPYDGAVILLKAENKPQVVAQRGFEPELIEFINNLDQLPPNMLRLIATKKPVYIPNTELDPEWIRLSGTGHVRCWLGVPLIYQDKLIGLLALDKDEPDYYHPSAEELVQTFANHAAVAIENARLFNEVQRSRDLLKDHVAARTRDLESLYEIAAITSQPLDLPAIMKVGLLKILDNLPCHSGMIHVLDKESGIFNLIESTNLDPTKIDKFRMIEPDNPFLREVIENEMPIVVPDATGDPRFVDWLLPTYNSCLVGIPMRTRGEVHGILSLYYDQDHYFTPDDIKLATSIADHMGVAIDNSNLQLQSEHAAVTEERERLASELHDSATQSLFSLTLFAAAAREKVRSGQLDIALQHLDEIGYTANQTHREMRLILYQLGNPQLEEEGFVQALERRLHAVEGRSGINATFHHQNAEDLSPEMEQTLYQIANEALNNALKHAGGTSVTVELFEEVEHVKLVVKDNGSGFDLGGANIGAGMGLRNMRLRASRMGGKLSIITSIGKGTEIVARIPRSGTNQQYH